MNAGSMYTRTLSKCFIFEKCIQGLAEKWGACARTLRYMRHRHFVMRSRTESVRRFSVCSFGWMVFESINRTYRPDMDQCIL